MSLPRHQNQMPYIDLQYADANTTFIITKKKHFHNKRICVTLV